MEKQNPAFFPSALVVFGNTDNLELGKLNDLGVWLEISPASSPTLKGGVSAGRC